MTSQMLLTIYSIVLGLCIGSFLNVLIVRLPEGKSINGRSACPKCRKKISWFDNIPLFSYLILRGKCRGCQTRISFIYPLIELLTAALSFYTFLWAQGDLKIYLVWFLLFVAPLIAVVVIDFKHQIIPDVISLPGIVVGVLANIYLQWPYWQGALVFSFMWILLGGGFLFALAYLYSVLRKKEGMGGGDIKLLGMLGAFLGWKALPVLLLLSSLLALVYALTLKLIQTNDEELIIPYGPFLVAAAFIQLYWGPQLLQWYLTGGKQ